MRYRYHDNDLKLRGRGHFHNVPLTPSTGIFVNRIYTEIICRVGPNRWLDSLRFNVPFNSISFISGRWKGEHEKLCAIKHVYVQPKNWLWYGLAIPNEPPHKTDKMTCTPSDDSAEPGHRPSLIRVIAVRRKKIPIERLAKTDQIRRMSRLIWVFAGRTVRLSVLSGCG